MWILSNYVVPTTYTVGALSYLIESTWISPSSKESITNIHLKKGFCIENVQTKRKKGKASEPKFYLGPELGNPFANASSAPTFSLNTKEFPSCNLEFKAAFRGRISI